MRIPRIKGDPLLGGAKAMMLVAEILLVFSMVLIAIGAATILTTHRAKLFADLAAGGAPPGTYFALLGFFAGAALLLFLALCFVIQLKRIVGTVEGGDPFLPVNADRLTRMACFALASQACEFVLVPLGHHVARYTANPHALLQAGAGSSVSLTGLALAVVLFILARVFRRGAALREDLEGTV